MTKEQLLALGLTEEQTGEVLKLKGLAITQLNNQISLLTTERDQIKGQLETANTKIDEFKDIDVDKLKNEIEDYKTKYEDSKTAHEEEVKGLKLNHDVDTALLGSKVKNVKAAKALLDMDALKSTNDFTETLKTQIEGLKESEGYLFDTGEPPVNSVTGGNPPAPKNPSEMTYSEMIAYMEANPGAKL